VGLKLVSRTAASPCTILSAKRLRTIFLPSAVSPAP